MPDWLPSLCVPIGDCYCADPITFEPICLDCGKKQNQSFFSLSLSLYLSSFEQTFFSLSHGTEAFRVRSFTINCWPFFFSLQRFEYCVCFPFLMDNPLTLFNLLSLFLNSFYIIKTGFVKEGSLNEMRNSDQMMIHSGTANILYPEMDANHGQWIRSKQ